MTSRSLLLIAVIVAATAPTLAMAQKASKQPELPLASALLVEKLDLYSKNLLDEAQAKIKAKRVEVTTVLEKHLQERTRTGDLDGAIAIRAVLEKWKAEETAANAPPSEKKSTKSPWKSLIGEGENPLQGWAFKSGEQIKVSEGAISIESVGKKYVPLYRPSSSRGNVALKATIEVAHDRSIEKEQQAGIGFQLAAKDGTVIGTISCVIQGPEANLLFGSFGDEEGSVLAMEKERAAIGKPSEMQFAFADGHFMVFVRKRKIHDFHDPRLENAGVANVILFANNSQAKFGKVEELVVDEEQAKLLLSGKPIE